MIMLPSRLPPSTGSIAAIVISVYSAIIGLGIGLRNHSPVYFADEWTWLVDVYDRGWWWGSVCNHFGHPAVLPNLHLLANYHWLDGSGTGRAMMVMAVFWLSALLIAVLTVRGLTVANHTRFAVMAVFSGFALWGGLGTKLWWSFGLTDGLALLGAVLTAYATVWLLDSREAPQARRAAGVMIAGGAIGTFSFGTGFVIWPAFAAVVLATRRHRASVIVFVLAGAVLIAIATFGLPSCTGSSVTGPAAPRSIGVIAAVSTAMTTIGVLPAHAFGMSRDAPAFGALWTVVGIVLTAAVCWLGLRILTRKETDAGVIALTGLAAVPIGAALLIGIARNEDFGGTTAYFPRYAALVMPLWLALLAVGVRLLLRSATESVRPAAVLLVAAAVLLTSNLRLAGTATSSHQGLTVRALNLLMSPAPKSSILEGTYKRTAAVFRSLPELKADRVSLWSDPIASAAGRIGQPALALAPDASCFGALVRRVPDDPARSDGYMGWAVAPYGSTITHLEAVRDGRVVGLGMAAGRGQNLSREAIGQLPVLVRFIQGFPGIGDAWRTIPGYAAIAKRGPPVLPDSGLTWTCILTDGRALRVK